MKKFLLNPFFSLDICFNRTHSLIIRANGDLYPCFMNNTRYFGNIYIDSFEKLLRQKENGISTKEMRTVLEWNAWEYTIK